VSVTITRHSRYQHAASADALMVRAIDVNDCAVRRQVDLHGAIVIDAPVHRCLRCPAQTSFAALSPQRLAELEAEYGRECRWLRTLVAAADIPLEPPAIADNDSNTDTDAAAILGGAREELLQILASTLELDEANEEAIVQQVCQHVHVFRS